MDEQIFEVVAKIMGVPVGEIGIDSGPASLPMWDSLQHIKLILALEEVYGIMFADDDLQHLVDVRTIAEVLALKLRHQ